MGVVGVVGNNRVRFTISSSGVRVEEMKPATSFGSVVDATATLITLAEEKLMPGSFRSSFT